MSEDPKKELPIIQMPKYLKFMILGFIIFMIIFGFYVAWRAEAIMKHPCQFCEDNNEGVQCSRINLDMIGKIQYTEQKLELEFNESNGG